MTGIQGNYSRAHSEPTTYQIRYLEGSSCLSASKLPQQVRLDCTARRLALLPHGQDSYRRTGEEYVTANHVGHHRFLRSKFATIVCAFGSCSHARQNEMQWSQAEMLEISYIHDKK